MKSYSVHSFCIWRFTLTVVFLWFIHVVISVNNLFLLFSSKYFLKPLCLSFTSWWTFGLFPFFPIMNKAAVNFLFFFFFKSQAGKDLEIEFLGFRIRIVCLTLCEIAKLSLKVVVPCYTTDCNVWEFQLLYILNYKHLVLRVYLILAILVGV